MHKTVRRILRHVTPSAIAAVPLAFIFSGVDNIAADMATVPPGLRPFALWFACLMFVEVLRVVAGISVPPNTQTINGVPVGAADQAQRGH